MDLEGAGENEAQPYRSSSLLHYTLIVFAVCMGNLAMCSFGILYLWISDKYEFTDFLTDYGFDEYSIKLTTYITIFVGIRFLVFCISIIILFWRCCDCLYFCGDNRAYQLSKFIFYPMMIVFTIAIICIVWFWWYTLNSWNKLFDEFSYTVFTLGFQGTPKKFYSSVLCVFFFLFYLVLHL